MQTQSRSVRFRSSRTQILTWARTGTHHDPPKACATYRYIYIYTCNEIEVTGNNSIILLPVALVGLHRRNQRAMAAVMEEQHVPRLGPVDHPAERPTDVGTSRHNLRARHVGQDHNVIGCEPEPLHDKLLHRLDVVDAAVELVAGVEVVAAHQRCQPLLPSLH